MRFASWSYSRLSDWQACPLMAKFKHIDKLPQPQSPAMARGEQLHKLAERYSTKQVDECPDQLQKIKPYLDRVRKVWDKIRTEEQWAFTRDWQQCDWFARETYCRMVVDLSLATASTMIVVDYKTGKINPDHKNQLSLYAVGGFSRIPSLQMVKAKLWYIDHGQEILQDFSRDEYERIRSGWINQADLMLGDEAFLPKKNKNCQWCAFKDKCSLFGLAKNPATMDLEDAF